MSSNLLTATRLATLRQCARKHYLRYELGLSRIRTADALRLGSAFHRGLELHNKGTDAAVAVMNVAAGYTAVPEWADPFKWDVERVTVEKLLSGHFWRYENDDVEIVEAERSFDMPLVNPDTGAKGRTFRQPCVRPHDRPDRLRRLVDPLNKY
ncbi:MAG: PD-(D/E)XK nuclease family protein [Phycisphaerae bacterium]